MAAPQPSSLPTPEQALEAYSAYLGTERQYSPLTIKNYARDIRQLFKAAGGAPLHELKSHQIRRFIAQLHGSGLGGKTLARMLSAWRGFYAFLVRSYHYAGNPCTGLRAPKSPRKLPHTLSPDEAVRMVDLPEEDGVLAIRDKAMFELLYSSGLRLAELVGLDIGALDFADASVRVTGKGSKTRIVPLGSHAIAALQAWLQVRADQVGDEVQAVFINRNGSRLGARSVQIRMKQWGIKQGISSNVHPHLLRHSFASHVLQSSGDLRAVQEMLGHASISTTQVYTHLDFQYLAKIYDGAHPRAKKKP
ncbi:MAG TPA: tyrosine recombinase XerC [Gallionellaceae bacterium]